MDATENTMLPANNTTNNNTTKKQLMSGKERIKKEGEENMGDNITWKEWNSNQYGRLSIDTRRGCIGELIDIIISD